MFRVQLSLDRLQHGIFEVLIRGWRSPTTPSTKGRTVPHGGFRPTGFKMCSMRAILGLQKPTKIHTRAHIGAPSPIAHALLRCPASPS
ncbi:hypothetical protein BJX63DRAFT_398163 [Aspergillus granulosus]|uniref:Uncharacterized protein n=1 Tax=Aspergillus granulosus TaxID=176169 RepID=A0ABR4H8H0_9EURO